MAYRIRESKKTEFSSDSSQSSSVHLVKIALKICTLLVGLWLISAIAEQTPVHAKQKNSVPSVCRDYRGRFASCGYSFDDFVDVVPSLRIPSISINLGRIIPSVSIGSPVKWGFKVPFSYTPRVKFMKFQVYFDPDFDYFTSKPGWITLAAFKAVGNQATVKSQNRVGTQKYRVYSPEGGGFESYTSPTSKKNLKGIPTTGTFTIDPNPIFENQRTNFSVQISDTTTPRIVYLLTKSTCDGSSPWVSKVGPGPGWNLLADSSGIDANNSAVISLQKSSYSGWDIVGKIDDSYSYSNFFKYHPTFGVTNGGSWSYPKVLGLADNGRCFAAISLASENKQMWVSNPVQLTVKPLMSSTLATNSTAYQSISTNSTQITGSISGGARNIYYKICNISSALSFATTSDAAGNFQFSIQGGLAAGTYTFCLSAEKTNLYQAAAATVQITVSRTALTGSISISTTAINTGQQFTVSGSTTPNVSNKSIWIRVYCSGATNYPTGWAAQTYVRPAQSYFGNPTGLADLSYYNYEMSYYSGTIVSVDANGNFTKTFTSNTPSTCVYGAYTPQTDYHTAWLSDPTSAITVSRTALTGSISISTTAINTGQQFTVSGSITPNVSNKSIWIRVYCSGATNYPTGWAAQTYVRPAQSYFGNPTGLADLSYYNYEMSYYSGTIVSVDANGNFTKTFTSNTPSTCVYGAYTPQTDYHTAWLSDPTSAITVSRTALTGSISISTTAINTGQQFTVSGSITPNVSNKSIWIRVYCSGATNYPTGWAAQTYVRPAQSYFGNPTGLADLSYYNYEMSYYSGTIVSVDANGNFTKTFTSNTPSTCVYGAYTPQTDYHTAWLSSPTSAITVS